MAPVFVLALTALTVKEIATGIDNVATDTILQKRVPEAFLGRVFAFEVLELGAGEALAYLAGGLIVDAIGPASTYVLAGATTAAAGLVRSCSSSSSLRIAATNKPRPKRTTEGHQPQRSHCVIQMVSFSAIIQVAVVAKEVRGGAKMLLRPRAHLHNREPISTSGVPK